MFDFAEEQFTTVLTAMPDQEGDSTSDDDDSTTST